MTANPETGVFPDGDLDQPVCDRCGETNVEQPGDWCEACVSESEPSDETLRQELQGRLEDECEKGAPR